MNTFLRRLRVAGLACALVTGLGVGVTAATAAIAASPASAANGPCYDFAIAQPTPVHFVPSEGSQTVKFLNSGSQVTGTCNYYDNTSENHWYMQVNYIGPGNNNGYGYIWVQRLSYGSGHNCRYNTGNTFPIGSGACPLYFV